MTTEFSNKVDILGEFYFTYRDSKELEDFIYFNDLGLPLAYLASENLCMISEDGASFINETWELLLASLKIEDTGFENLEDLMSNAQKE